MQSQNNGTEYLLSDDQVRHFLINGYLVIKPVDTDKSLHDAIRAQTLDVFASEVGNPGNNILPMVPQLSAVMCSDRALSGALRSLLGDEYVLMPHRHCHVSAPRSTEQQWHRDSYWGNRKPLRNHCLRYVMAMYYPQRVTVHNGPTAARSGGTQYLEPLSGFDRTLPFDVDEKTKAKNDEIHKDVLFEVDAGDVVLIHFDILHRATSNLSSDPRLMFKFQFCRLGDTNPAEPTWNCTERNWDALEAPEPLRPIVRHTWQWMTGNYALSKSVAAAVEDDLSLLERNLFHPSDALARAHAAYTLAACGRTDTLLEHVLHSDSFLTHIVHGLAAAVPHWNDAFTKRLLGVLETTGGSCNATAIASIAWLLAEVGGVLSDPLSLSAPFFPALMQLASAAEKTLAVNDNGEQPGESSRSGSESAVWIRLYAVEALANMTMVLCPLVQSNSERQLVVRVTDTLIQRLHNEPDGQVRFNIALGLAKLAPFLCNMTSTVDSSLPARTIDALLQSAQNDSNRYVVANSQLALKRVGTREAMDHYVQLLEVARWCPFTKKDSLY